MTNPKTKKLFYKFFHEPRNVYWREAPFAKRIIQFLPKTGSFIDIGCASGKMAEYIANQTGLEPTLLDVLDYNESNLQLQTYDGDKIPYKRNNFDVALLVFVLHHATDQVKLLAEAKRVTKKRLIVIEDTPTGWLEKRAWQRWDYLLNTGYHHDINQAHFSRSSQEWSEIFAKAGFKISAKKTFRSFMPVLASYKHTMFVLDKKD